MIVHPFSLETAHGGEARFELGDIAIPVLLDCVNPLGLQNFRVSGEALSVNNSKSTQFLQVSEFFCLCEDVFVAEWVFKHLVPGTGRWGKWIFCCQANFECLFLLGVEGQPREATPHIPPLSSPSWVVG